MTKEIVTTKIAVFQKTEIRKIIHKNEWWFSVVDVIEALTGTDRPRKYWNDLKKKLIKEGYSEVSENIGQLCKRGQPPFASPKAKSGAGRLIGESSPQNTVVPQNSLTMLKFG